MSQADQLHLCTLLSEAPDFRAFMQSYVDWKKSTRRGYGYASLARESGFSARSYPRDVILGTRPLTESSLSRFTKAMRLTGEAARYFRLLVYRDRPELRKGTTNADIDKLLEKSRVRLLRHIHNRKQDHLLSVYSQNAWPIVYASLGSDVNGASMDEISARARIPYRECEKILQEMERHQVVRKHTETGKFLSHNPHLIYQGLGNNSAFKDFFLASIVRAKKNAQANFSEQDRLFFSSAISVKRSNLQKYRLKLRELLDTFAENAEDVDGEDIVSIVCSLFPND